MRVEFPWVLWTQRSWQTIPVKRTANNWPWKTPWKMPRFEASFGVQRTVLSYGHRTNQFEGVINWQAFSMRHTNSAKHVGKSYWLLGVEGNPSLPFWILWYLGGVLGSHGRWFACKMVAPSLSQSNEAKKQPTHVPWAVRFKHKNSNKHLRSLRIQDSMIFYVCLQYTDTKI